MNLMFHNLEELVNWRLYRFLGVCTYLAYPLIKLLQAHEVNAALLHGISNTLFRFINETAAELIEVIECIDKFVVTDWVDVVFVNTRWIRTNQVLWILRFQENSSNL